MDTKTKRTILFVIGMALVVGVIGTLSYAFFSSTGESTPEQATISTGTARVTFSDNDTGITGQLAFGESITKTFTIENTGTVEANVKMYWKDLINTYLPESLTFTLSQAETSDGTYTEIVSKTRVPKNTENPEAPKTIALSNTLTIPVGATYYYNLVITLNNLSDIDQSTDIGAKFSSTFDLKDVNYIEPNPVNDIIASSQGVRTSFDTPATTDEGIFEMQDDYGTSYYYRGAVENNYVKYGVNKDGQEMWWRIIRINGDGSIRMIYDGTQGYANGTVNKARYIKTSQPYNALYDDAKYVGWMYGPANASTGTTTASTSKAQAQSNVADSDIKKIVDSWYKENIVDTGYSGGVSDEIFCNDRSTPGKDLTGWSSDTGLGYGKNTTAYGAYARMKRGFSDTGLTPSFVCPEKIDAFTVSDTSKGNGSLTYPVGLITADEIVGAGSGKYNTSNSKYYLYHGTGYLWSLSPYSFNGTHAFVFNVYTSGQLDYYYVTGTSGAVAPVINLSAEYASTLKGTGNIDDPYRLSTP